MTTFGTRVREIRKQRGWTQQELANRTGVSRETISNWERGTRVKPAVSDAYAVAQALDVTVESLLHPPSLEVVGPVAS